PVIAGLPKPTRQVWRQYVEQKTKYTATSFPEQSLHTFHHYQLQNCAKHANTHKKVGLRLEFGK
ncbi:hypothetical protein, partial [Escherichia coli]|uniref:hypothetical protein n=1 Tax=Escherichia coli TaxID=562 RepID=UPI00112A320B